MLRIPAVITGERPRMTWNHPEPPRTTHNHPESPRTTRNHPEPPIQKNKLIIS